MNIKRKSEYIGALGALLVHVAIIALLILVSFAIPHPDEEAGGVPVMMGDVDAAYGNYDPSTMVDVEVLPEEVPAPQSEPEVETEQEMITQTEEETVVVKPKAEPKKEKPKVAKKPEKTPEEKAAEAKKLAEEKAERERKAAAEAASKRVAGAFGKGSQMGGSKGTATSGEGVYNVQEEGRVVVSITVNPAGHVIATSINRLTNTVNSTLRKAAEDAAKKARFNAVDGVNNQTGTITYYFNLK